MRIIRYSTDGFKPQKQTHHAKLFEYYLNTPITSYPVHLQPYIKEIIDKKNDFYRAHYEDLQEGIWFFVKGYKNNQSLNHLKYRVPCWEGEISENIMVYDFNLEKVIPVTDGLVLIGGCYLPKRLIPEIYNIRKVKRKE